MLHELLFALRGNLGGLFVEKSDGTIQVLDDVPFLSPSEISQLRQLCTLATCYKGLCGFIQEHGMTGGLYARSLSLGLTNLLGPYLEKLSDIELQLLADPGLTLACLVSQLDEFFILLSALSSFVDFIKQHKIEGCHILDVISKRTFSGIPMIQTAMKQLLFVGCGVMYKQLAAWLLHGLLLDRQKEFFVQKVDSTAASDVALVAVDDDELGLGGITGRQLEQMLQLEMAEVMQTSQKFGSFVLHAKMLPAFIPSRVAEKILFIGEAVHLFSAKDKLAHQDKSLSSLYGDIEVEFSKRLHKLSDADFDLRAFDVLIDDIRTHVAGRLWELIVLDADLLGNLNVVKDFFLLGRGELFLAFIDQAQALLSVPPSATTPHDVNAAFQHAAQSILMNDDKLLRRFQFTTSVPATVHKKGASTDAEPIENGWRSLNLTYSVESPLNVIFTEGVLGRYNALFKFLLNVRQVQTQLHHCWAQQMLRRQRGGADTGAPKWALRKHMSFLVDNLQYYLQVDVIESQFSILVDKIQSTRDFEEIQLAHDIFLATLLGQFFLLSKPIRHCIGEILELCQQFCGLVTHTDVLLSDRQTSQLDTIVRNFQLQSRLLFELLSSIRGHQSGPHLAKLLLRIDYNYYYSMAGGRLGSILPTQR